MSGPHPAVAQLRSAARAALSGFTPELGPDDLVLVACSGGPDSLALAAATAFVAPRLGLRAGGLIVDHGWFDGSAEVAAGAAAACARLGLAPVEVLHAADVAVPPAANPAGRRSDGPARGGPEAIARAARYAALEAAAQRLGAVAVLLGHTLDDQAETVLLGLARGSGARSAAGMRARRGLWLRPLLGVPRRTTTAACGALGLTPWHDPANADPRYTRARVRAALAELGDALGPGLASALARTGEMLAADDDLLSALADELRGRAEIDEGAGGPEAASGPAHAGVLEVAVLQSAPVALRHRVLHTALLSAGCPGTDLTRSHVLAVDALITAWHGQRGIDLPGGVSAVRHCGRLVLSHHRPPTGPVTGSAEPQE